MPKDYPKNSSEPSKKKEDTKPSSPPKKSPERATGSYRRTSPERPTIKSVMDRLPPHRQRFMQGIKKNYPDRWKELTSELGPDAVD